MVQRALVHAGASPAMARSTARALVAADAEGLASHGVSRVPQYAAHLRLGRVEGRAVPTVIRERGGAALVDAGCGLAFPACALAVEESIRRARSFGVAFVGVTNSHHFGVAGHHLAPVAEAGMVGLAFGNSPAAMPAAGGRRPLFGTNPIAAVFPRASEPPLAIDLSLSEVARGKLMVAAKEGREIPVGWALDRDGNPTTDPRKGLEGSMLPAGGAKGAMLALVVELLACALTGAAMGFEADSFFVDEGNRPRIGQAFLAIDPDALAGRDVYFSRVEALVTAMLGDPGVRLPGSRRVALARQASREGVEVGDALLAQLATLAVAGDAKAGDVRAGDGRAGDASAGDARAGDEQA
jgi:(2R)-3-sulfolactate dehydrogenase (NADP+)